MKKLMCLMMMLGLLASCSSGNEDFESANISEDEIPFTFTVSPYVIEPMTRGAGDPVTITSVCSKIDLFLVCGDDDVISAHQVSTDTNYGTISVVLNKKKTYSVYLVAHNSTSAATLSGDKTYISFADDNITDTYYYTGSLTPTTSSLTCAMTHTVARFSVWITDAFPSTVDKVVINTSDSGKKLAVTGVGTDVGSLDKVFTSWTSASSGTMLSMNVLPTSVTESVTMDFTVTAYEGTVVRQSRPFNDVTMRAGYKTMYKGEFFIDNPFGFSLSGIDWYSYDTVDF